MPEKPRRIREEELVSHTVAEVEFLVIVYRLRHPAIVTMASWRSESRLQIICPHVQRLDRAFGFSDGGFSYNKTRINRTDRNQFWMARYKARDLFVIIRDRRSVTADHDSESVSSVTNLIEITIPGLRSNEVFRTSEPVRPLSHLAVSNSGVPCRAP